MHFILHCIQDVAIQTVLKGMLKAKLIAQITVNSDDGKLLKFTCFNDALKVIISNLFMSWIQQAR